MLEAYLPVIPNVIADAGQRDVICAVGVHPATSCPLLCLPNTKTSAAAAESERDVPAMVLLLLVQIRDQSTPDFTSPFVRRPFQSLPPEASKGLERQDGRCFI